MKIKITSHRNPSLVGRYAIVLSRGENFKNMHKVALTQNIEYVGEGCFERVEEEESKVLLSINIGDELFTKLMTQCQELGISIDEYVESILRTNNGR
jgi:hypothetical protein